MNAERNAPCPCGSGKKFKRCHFLADHEAERQSAIAKSERIACEAAEARQGRVELARRGRVIGRGQRISAAALLGIVAAVMPPTKR